MHDRTVLVTGASTGIGAAICRRIAGPGVKLLIHARGGDDGMQNEPLEAVAGELREKGAEVETAFEDLRVPGVGSVLVEKAVERFGSLDHVVSNAGFADSRAIGDVDRAAFDQAYSGMAGAFFDMATAAVSHLKRSECGRVVAISSFVAHHYGADSLFPVTAAAKCAVEALAKTLAVQLGPHGVTVNCVAPGYTRKDASAHRAISPQALQQAADRALTRRIADPGDVAAMVGFLLSQEARQITGQVIRVDGGLGLA